MAATRLLQLGKRREKR